MEERKKQRNRKRAEIWALKSFRDRSETVLEALTDSREELAAVPEEQRAVVRPWLQAFTATWVQGHISYDGEEIRSQIQAVYDAGYEEWFLWNAANRYTADGLLPEEEDSGQ